tara:strand:- start:181 stop:381 length:201 start_codon:yes stop_codon:yes gene_type:complete
MVDLVEVLLLLQKTLTQEMETLEVFHHQREMMVETVMLPLYLAVVVELAAQAVQERDLALEVVAVM